MYLEKISIIVPVYKVENYLEKCVKSITNQTYKNIEIILVDDGSPDKCGDMCEILAKEDERIKVIHQENGGLSAARNTGIENATGEYIAFVDSDDYISEDYCETLYRLLKETKSGISSVSYTRFMEGTTPEYVKEEYNENDIIVYENEAIVKELLERKTFQSIVWNKLYKKEVLKNKRFPVNVNYEDVYFSYEVLTDVKKVAYIDRKCYFYLKRASSISATYSEKNLKNFLFVAAHKFNGIKNRFPNLKLYNYYAFFESMLGVSLLYVKSNCEYPGVYRELDEAFGEIYRYIEFNSNDFMSLLDDFQKACVYTRKFNKELFYRMLKDFQELKSLGKIK